MLKTLLTVLALAGTAGPALAADEAPSDALFEIAGQYAVIDPPQPTAGPDKVEVVEMFWYGCPHCYHFEPHLEAWLDDKPEYVTFTRMPAVFRRGWIPHAQAFYTAEALGVLDRIHGPLFDALHQDKRKIYSRAELADFFVAQGVDRVDFNRTYDSFAVKSKVKQAIIMTERYGISGVPSVIVNGKYRTSGSMADGFEGMLRVVEVLAGEEHQEKGTQQARNEPANAVN